MNGGQQFGAGSLLIVNNYILGLIWGNDSIYLFDYHGKDENSNLSIAICNTLYSLENYVRSVYYNTFPLTLYFQVEFLKVHSTATAKNATKSELKKERLSARRERGLLAKKRKYHDNP